MDSDLLVRLHVFFAARSFGLWRDGILACFLQIRRCHHPVPGCHVSGQIRLSISLQNMHSCEDGSLNKI